MKFSTALFLSGAAVASAAVLPRDSCPAVKKTVLLTWIELSVFEEGKAATWSLEEAKAKMGNSKASSSGYPVYSTKASNGTGSYPTLAVPSGYPTGKVPPYGLGTGAAKPTSSAKATGKGYTSTSTKAPLPSSVSKLNGTISATSTSTGSGFRIAATSSSSASSTTSSAEPEATLQAWPCTAPAVRREWRNLDDGERDSYISAVRCLMNRPSGDSGRFPGSRNRFEDFVSLHQQLTPTIHSLAQFLPWHRYYLHVYEQVLSDECGYNGPLVWWDETLDAGRFSQAPLFTERWFGPAPSAVNGQGVCVTSTGWGNYQPNIGPGGATNNPHCLSRAVDEGLTAVVSQDYVNQCRGADNYNSHRECTEYGPHAYGHNGIGAVMSDVSPSPSDPVFYLHHGFVDRNFKVWQNDQWWNRVYEINGPSNGNGDQITADYVLTSYGIRPDARISDVLDTEATYLCYVYDKQ